MKLPIFVETADGLYMDGKKIPYVIEGSVEESDGVLTFSVAHGGYFFQRTSDGVRKQRERTLKAYSFLD